MRRVESILTFLQTREGRSEISKRRLPCSVEMSIIESLSIRSVETLALDAKRPIVGE